MKKQLNYKSLNTLGDVDITQSVVPGGGTAESTMEYLDVSGLDEATTLTVLKKIAQSVKWRSTAGSSVGEINIAPYGLFGPPSINGVEQAEFLAAAIDLEQLILNPSGGLSELTPLSTLLPFLGVDLAAIPRITKEEFYKLPVALKIYTYEEDAIAHQEEMKTAFDTLWAIWERDGVEGQELAITIPNADIASITFVTYDGEESYSPTSMMGGTTTSTSDTVTYIELNGQYGPQIRKVENLITGEITYEYYYAA